MLRKKLWIILLISSSCFNQAPSKKIDFEDYSDFDVEKFKKTRKDEAKILQAKKHYKKYCVSCHGQQAEGRVGPNLTDSYWLHGKGTIQDIYKVIRYGVTSKGMRAYESQLTDEEIMAISAYILGLKGSSPKGAKNPQGELIN